ncbi:DJ-1/PfpI family protein [Ruminococcus gauvreauii]|uniref:DJ-1/PfpI family protein n=1 Tax=Ruminococcus gauvreauii TaxID=438033 RepID=A0ABY5VI49_9FIRM|nr:DJ-1/PfpI family protein [Ruminococcus gauvreauii]UWP59881.1 DJ-1/PfpI family protein [Ruminococcus gauvreauii]
MVVNVLLYDSFETMDAFVPVSILGKLPEHFYMNYLSASGGIINSLQDVKVWTEPLEENAGGDILLIPGGKGARRLILQEQDTLRLIKEAAGAAGTVIMVGSGSAVLAQTGALYHRTVAEFASGDNWKRMFTAGIYWTRDTGWISDGKFYSCQRSADASDMILGMIADLIDINDAGRAAEALGLQWSEYDYMGQ